MTDEEISQKVTQCAKDFCRALNLAGEAGLHIDVHFQNQATASFTDGTIKKTDWRSGTTLKRVTYV